MSFSRYHLFMFSLLFQQPLVFIAWLVAILIAFSAHEFSHALVGTWLGDMTAKRMGRLTLNPLAHVDPFGFLSLVIVGFGWGKPVPFNPYNLRNQKWGPVAIALAGPAMNLLLATIFGLTFRLVAPHLSDSNLLVQFLLLSIFLNLGLLLFNLIPLPPLDGSKVLIALLHRPSTDHIRVFLEIRGPALLFMLIILDLMLNIHIFSGLFRLVERLASAIVGA